MSIKRKAISRAGSLAAAVVVSLAALVPVVVPRVFAAAPQQVQYRSIEMSDATPGQTGVDYTVSFTTAQAGAESMVIDFCNDGSIIGATCTAPTGMVVTGATFTSISGTTNWTLDSASGSTVKLKDPSAPTNVIGATTAVSFKLGNITNPTQDASTPTPKPAGTLWARVYTYDSADYGLSSSPSAPYTSPTALGTYLDYGGFAMSTTDLINISATVMETLTFCIDHQTISAGCSALTNNNSVVLGSGTPKVLSTANGTGSSAPAFFQISTNALHGAVVKMKTHNTCSGLSRDGGTTCDISGIGATASTLTTINQALFGVNVAADTPLGSTIGTLNPTAPYSTPGSYAMDDTTVGNSVLTGGGTKLADTIVGPNNGAAADLGGVLNFDAEAAATTPAGVYTADESLIATGTF